MTPDRLRECIGLLYWSQKQLARILNRDERGVRRWFSGQNAVDPPVAEWLETWGRFAEANPPPVYNRQSDD
jgi:ribosome-binding protein aMBF1 (putative translation factor)